MPRPASPPVALVAAAVAAVGVIGLVLLKPSAASAASASPLGPATPLPPEWARFFGARPEIRGWPENTILAVPGLEKLSSTVRQALLDLATETGIPVDSIAVTLAHESGLNPRALYSAPDNAERRAEGRPEFYAAGLSQLTPGAHLPGFESAAAVRAVADMSAEEQMRAVVGPLWRGHAKRAAGAHPGLALLANFLPANVGRPASTVLCDRNAEGEDDAAKRSRAVCRSNGSMDVTKDGKLTIDDVYASAAQTARTAKGERLAVDGSRLTAPAALTAAASSSTPSSNVSAAPPPAKASPSTAVAPASAPPSAAPSSPATPPTAAPSPAVAPARVASSTASPGASAWPPRPLSPGDRVGGLLLAAVRAGAFEAPSFVEVPFVGTGQWEGKRYTLRVGTRSLRAPVPLANGGTALLRLPVSYKEVIEICRLKGWMPPTQSMSDQIWQAAKHLHVTPLGKWDTAADANESSRKMRTLEWCQLHNKHCDDQIGSDLGLWRDDGKDWLLHPRVDDKPNGAVNYGFRRDDGTPWQTVGGAHDNDWYDYSQTFLVLDRKAKDETGAEVDLIDVLAHLPKPLSPSILAPFR